MLVLRKENKPTASTLLELPALIDPLFWFPFRLILPYERFIKGEEDKPLPPIKPRKQENSSQENENKTKVAGAKRIKHEISKSKKEKENAPKPQDASEVSCVPPLWNTLGGGFLPWGPLELSIHHCVLPRGNARLRNQILYTSLLPHQWASRDSARCWMGRPRRGSMEKQHSAENWAQRLWDTGSPSFGSGSQGPLI